MAEGNPFQQFVNVLGDATASGGFAGATKNLLARDPLASGGSIFATSFLEAFNATKEKAEEKTRRQTLAESIVRQDPNVPQVGPLQAGPDARASGLKALSAKDLSSVFVKQLTATPQKLPESIRTKDLLGLTREEQAELVRKGGKQEINIDLGGGKKFFEELGKEAAQEVTTIRKGAVTAREALKNTQRFENSLKAFKTGTGANAVIEFGKLAQVFNFDLDVSAGEDIKSVGNAFALGFKEKLPGILSDNDIILLKSLAPQLGTSSEANKKFLSIITSAAEGKIELNNQVTQFRRERGVDITATGLSEFIDTFNAGQLEKELKNIDFISKPKEVQELLKAQDRLVLEKRREELRAKAGIQ